MLTAGNGMVLQRDIKSSIWGYGQITTESVSKYSVCTWVQDTWSWTPDIKKRDQATWSRVPLSQFTRTGIRPRGQEPLITRTGIRPRGQESQITRAGIRARPRGQDSQTTWTGIRPRGQFWITRSLILLLRQFLFNLFRLISHYYIKGSVSRDFRPPVFFLIRTLLGPW